MADEPASATPAEATTPAAPETPETPAATEAPLGEAGQKALEAMKQRARDAEAQLKELKPLAEKARELEDAQKSELEKAQGKLTKAEQAAADANAKLLRFEVAQEKEVPAKLVPLLTAKTKEDLEAQADLILENVKAGEESPDFNGGAREPAPDPKTPEEAHNETFLQALGLRT
jgi:hypothetical protein